MKKPNSTYIKDRSGPKPDSKKPSQTKKPKTPSKKY